jgi:glucosamine--fructose-6-phosphate aminotransferase (isomerizing)
VFGVCNVVGSSIARGNTCIHACWSRNWCGFYKSVTTQITLLSLIALKNELATKQGVKISILISFIIYKELELIPERVAKALLSDEHIKRR